MLPKRKCVANVFCAAGNSAWVADVSNYYQSLTVRLPRRFNISGVATRGRPDLPQYVTEYVVQCSDDGYTWRTYASDTNQDEVAAANASPSSVFSAFLASQHEALFRPLISFSLFFHECSVLFSTEHDSNTNPSLLPI